MTYTEKLKDKRWLYKRLSILIRDKFRCQLCDRQNLNNHIHHKKYGILKKAWEYPDENLITVCNECHRKIHYSLISNKKISSLKIGNIIKKHYG